MKAFLESRLCYSLHGVHTAHPNTPSWSPLSGGEADSSDIPNVISTLTSVKGKYVIRFFLTVLSATIVFQQYLLDLTYSKNSPQPNSRGFDLHYVAAPTRLTALSIFLKFTSVSSFESVCLLQFTTPPSVRAQYASGGHFL